MDPKLAQAVQAIKSGDKAGGMVLLAQVLRSDPNNESAWIWMATAQDDTEKKKQSLERVLRINPGNEAIRRALSVLYPIAAVPAEAPVAVEAAPEAVEAVKEEGPQASIPEEAGPVVQDQATAASELPSVEIPAVSEPEIATSVEQPEVIQPAVEQEPPPEAGAEVSAEPAQLEPAAPDLSWLTEAPSEPEKTKEEAPDLSWLKEDLPQEMPPASGIEGFETAKAEPSEPEWLKETFQSPETNAAPGDLSSASAPTPGEMDDLAWLRGISSPGSQEMEGAPGDKTPSWLPEASSDEEKDRVSPFDESALPWLNESAAPAEAPAVKNEADAMPEWLHLAPGEAAIPTPEEPKEEGQSAERIQTQENPTLESEPLSLEDLDAITARKAELPFSWDEVTGKPVMKSAEEDLSGPVTASVEDESLTPGEAAPESAPVMQSDQSEIQAAPSAIPSISRPRPVAAQAAAAPAKPAQKKGMSTGQIALLVGLGVVTVFILLAFAFYLAVNFGLLKAFGF